MGKRADSIGFFWQDEEKVRTPIEKVKRTPPERTWESPDYLPHLEQALAFEPDCYTDYEIGQRAGTKEQLVFDSEVNPNYALFAFRSKLTRKVIYFELDDEPCGREFNRGKLLYVLTNFCIVNFNGIKFDFVIAAMGVAGCTTEQMWEATQMLISYGLPAKEVYKRFNVPKLPALDRIDLIELTPLAPGLKVCAGRLHAKRMQDLPFVVGSVLSEEQKRITFLYCFNDLDNTELLLDSLSEQIKVREEIGAKYGLDLRSHSDPQMAETVIASELRKMLRRRLHKVVLPEGTCYPFKPAPFLRYQTERMRHVLRTVSEASFAVSEFDGGILVPDSIVPVAIANNVYTMGSGGLHSTEKSVAHYTDDEYFIADTDATSYYPFLIRNAGIFPKNLGTSFSKVYGDIVEARVAAKRAGNNVMAQCLKIVVNGTFGKLGSKYSLMYAPDLMLQVTMTGQLSLLMLIELFELNGIQVLQANTDGIVTRCKRSDEKRFYEIVRYWEKETGFSTEEVRYKALLSRDVNNYIAVYETPQGKKRVKGKGVYAPTSSAKNAVNEVCLDAVTAMILDGTPILTTLQACTTLSKFTSMRRVKGGAVKDGEYLGKIIRWYYSTQATGEIVYAMNGNKVPRSEGARPCMDLPDQFPEDIDYAWYENEATRILRDIGFLPPEVKQN